MKNRLLIILITLLALTLLFAGCNSGDNYTGVEVTYKLEGGIYQNGAGDVTQYYQFAEGAQKLIKPLQTFVQSSEFKREGYDFVGWYRTKNDNGTYSDPWNFAADTVGEDGVTLYACWKKSVAYVYKVYDYDNPENLVNTMSVNEGSKFEERYGRRSGYTLLAVYDQNRNPWDDTFRHPGSAGEVEGETEVAVIVYAKYVEGNFSLVKKASDLSSAASLRSDIYLLNDIDMGGKELTFGNFSGKFFGNGYTVRNFVLAYSDKIGDLLPDPDDNSKKCLALSLFGIAENATVKDVTFESFTVNVNTANGRIDNIYVSAVATSLTNCTVSNVTVSGTVTVTKAATSAGVPIPVNLRLDQAACFTQNSSVTNFVSQLILQNNSED